MSHSAEKFRRGGGESFSVSLISVTEKVWIRGGGSIKIFRRKFLSHSTENFRRGILYCCNNFGYRKSLDKGGGEYHDFPSKFLSHCTEIFNWRTLWCFRKILLSKIFMHRKGASRFCRNFLSHRTETKSFVKEPFCFPEIFWYRKRFMDKRGHVTIFSRNFYVSQCRKLSKGNPTVFEKIFGFKKVYG